jgi:hypothetical protein
MNKPWNITCNINIDSDILTLMNSFINHIQSESGKRLVAAKAKSFEGYDVLKEYIENLYTSGYGLKIISREFSISYSRMRTLMKIFDINIRKGYDVVTDKLKEFRKYRVSDGRSPWQDPSVMDKNKYSHGIQGYYKKSDGDVVWLRSTWEYIYAKWLDKNKIIWTYEEKQYKIGNNSYYRPDFFIYVNGELSHVVELKGYHDDKLYKVELFEEKHLISTVVIRDISDYCNSYEKELKEWKQIRKLKK